MADSARILLRKGDTIPTNTPPGYLLLTVDPTTEELVSSTVSGTNYYANKDHNHDTIYYRKSDVDTFLAGKKDDFSENTAFNKNFGTGHTEVARGDHQHEWRIVTLDGIDIVGIKESNREKLLSVETLQVMWSEGYVSNYEWLKLARATDADTGFIAPHNGTVVGVTAFCEDGNNKSQVFRLFINSTDVGNIVQFPSGSGNVSFVDTTLNIDFNRLDRIRIRAGGNGTIYDTNISLLIKWRLE